jgi:RNA recognition motif-containing protein
MAKRLFVGGIAWATTDDSLQAAFAQAGTVEYAKIATDRMTGRSRGFGFVEMATEEEAQKAIALWDGKELDGRVLKVNEAMPREERA